MRPSTIPVEGFLLSPWVISWVGGLKRLKTAYRGNARAYVCVRKDIYIQVDYSGIVDYFEIKYYNNRNCGIKE